MPNSAGPGGRPPEPPRDPVSTYRLQLQPGFGFADAAAVADYLADLGVTDVYLSPILQATPGSTHGYDVVDHSRVSEDLGGEAAFRDMVARFRGLGLGVIVDIVPNHMAVPVPESLNQPLWSVLRDGTGSPFAGWFDVDWAAQDGRLLMPVLGGPLRDCLGDLELGDLELGDLEPGDPEAGGLAAGSGGAGPVLRYFGHEFPVRPGTEGLPLPELLDAQHYRLADWRLAATELNWRRFFDISSLIAVRVEDPAVFEATHEVILRLVAEGLIDGLRVDHPDGLADPRGYLRRLADRTGGALGVHREDPVRAGTAARGLAVRRDHRLRRAGRDRRPVPRPGRRRAAGRRLRAPHRRARPVRGGGRGRQARGGRPGPRGRGVPAVPAGRRGGAPRPGRPQRGGPGRRAHRAAHRDARVPGVRGARGARASRSRPRSWTGPLAAARPRLPERLHAALDAVADLVLGRAGAPARPAHRDVPAGVRPGHGQGRGGHRLLPLVAAGRAERGRRRPGLLRDQPGGVPRVRRAAGPGLAGQHDHAVHARHQAPGGRPGPAGRAGRDPGRTGPRR